MVIQAAGDHLSVYNGERVCGSHAVRAAQPLGLKPCIFTHCHLLRPRSTYCTYLSSFSASFPNLSVLDLYLTCSLGFEYREPELPPLCYLSFCVTFLEVGPRAALEGPVPHSSFPPLLFSFPLAAGNLPSSYLISPLLTATRNSRTHF